MLTFIECPRCRSKMPPDAKFCGTCGIPLEAVEAKRFPLWQLFKRGAFIKYRVNAFGERCLFTYRVLQMTENIIEFICIKNKGNKETQEFTYIGRDRRHYAPENWKGFTVESAAPRFKRQYSFNELIPTEYYTNLWINNDSIKIGDKIRIHTFDKEVMSEMIENGRIFYLIGDKSEQEPVLYYYDAKTGLLWKFCANHKVLSELVSTWISL